jgi:putative transcriptional regulator
MSRMPKSRICAEVFEMAQDMRNAGAIDDYRMREYGALCLQPTPTYTCDMVRELRERLKISQTAMARLLNASPSTVQKWEIGTKKPSGPSCKLLYLLDRKGTEVLQF